MVTGHLGLRKIEIRKKISCPSNNSLKLFLNLNEYFPKGTHTSKGLLVLKSYIKILHFDSSKSLSNWSEMVKACS